jgi:gas vesicle structural protein
MANGQLQPVDRAVGRATSSLVEILDRVLDKGIVIDAWVSVSVIGIELITIEARVIVASVETYVKYAEALKTIGPVAGGIRAEENRKSLGEGLQEIEQGLGSLPLMGEQRQASTTQRSSRPASKRRTKSKSKK